MRDCIAFICHVWNPSVQAVFERLQREAPPDLDVRFVLSSEAEPASLVGLAPEHLIQVSREDLFRLGYPEKCRTDQWEMAGNLDLVFLEVFRRQPEYDRYWFIEYDVHWEGRWDVLFERFRGSDADMLATTVLRIEQVPHKLAELSYPRLLMPPGMVWSRSQLLKAFLPICRISKAALDALQQAYRDGLGGHYEITVPSIAAHAGLVVEDIGGNGPFVRPQNRNRFYFARGSTSSHSPGSFVFRPAPKVLPYRNTLWHPVKPDAVPLWHPLRMGGSPLKTLVERLKPFIWRCVIRLWFATRWRPYDALSA